MRSLVFASLVALAGLTGCSRGLTIDESYGSPDATEWTYFDVEAQDLISAITRYYSIRDIATESIREESNGLVLTLAPQRGSASTGQILVQAVTTDGFQSRAQLYPTRRPLPRDLEIGVGSGL